MAAFGGPSCSTSGPCGTDCVSRANNTNVSAGFSGYRVKMGSEEVPLAGASTAVPER